MYMSWEMIQINSFSLKKCLPWSLFLFGEDLQQPLLLHVPGLIAQVECYNLLYACDSTYITLLNLRYDHLSSSSQNTRTLLVFVGCL